MTKAATAQAPAAAPRAASAPADAKTDADKAAETDSEAPADGKGTPAAAATPAPADASREPALAKNQKPAAVIASRLNQRRAERASNETEGVSAPPVNDHTPSYLWVGRFEREDKAQSAAKKIEDLGLPVSVVPRHTATGDFFAVFTGPYGPERVESAMDYLKTQGFSDVRLVKNPLGNQRQSPNN